MHLNVKLITISQCHCSSWFNWRLTDDSTLSICEFRQFHFAMEKSLQWLSTDAEWPSDMLHELHVAYSVFCSRLTWHCPARSQRPVDPICHEATIACSNKQTNRTLNKWLICLSQRWYVKMCALLCTGYQWMAILTQKHTTSIVP